MLPPQLMADRANLDQLLQWLVECLRRARSERAGLEEDWTRFQRAYRAKPENEVRDFPWKGAANVVIPIIGTDVDTTVAGVLGSLRSARNLWTTEAQRPDIIEWASRLQEFLQWAQDNELRVHPVLRDFVTETVKLGTGVLKRRYRRERGLVYEFREGAQATDQVVRRTIADRPELAWVPLPNFYVPATSSADHTSWPWCAERLTLNWSQLQARVAAGIYDPRILDATRWTWQQQQSRSEWAQYGQAMQELAGLQPGLVDEFELFEFHTKYDITRSGEPMALVCTIHVPSMTFARVDFNPFFNQENPYSSARFIAQEGQFYGLGLAELQESIQDAVSALECQRLDSGTVRNVPLFKGRLGSGLKADTPIWPGAILMMSNPAEDLLPVHMGQDSVSTVAEEQFLVQYAKQRSGISAWQAGGAGEPAISYSAATTTVEMLKQGRLRLDQFLREVDEALSVQGQGIVELYQQFSQGSKPYLVLGDREGAMVQRVLDFPLELIRASVLIRTTATSAQLNKETQVRTTQIILGATSNFYSQSLQALQVAANPQLPPPMRALAMMMVGGNLVLSRRMLDLHGIQDLDKVLPDPEWISAIAQQLGIQLPSSLGAVPGGPGMGQGALPSPGVPYPAPGGPGAYGAGPPQDPFLGGPAGGLPLTGPVYGPPGLRTPSATGPGFSPFSR